MSTQRASWLAWSLFALAVALGIGFLPLFVAVTRAASAPDTPFPPQAVAALQMSALGWIETLVSLVGAWAFAALGDVIVSRSPAHAIGWIFCALGLEFTVEYFADYYAIYTLFLAPGALPGGLVAGWVQHWIWLVGIMLICAFVPLLFPTGRLLSARWKPAWWLASGVTVATALVVAFQPGALRNQLFGFHVPNPLGVAGLGAVAPVLNAVLFVLLLASILVAVASLVVRLRRARGVERQQIKWFGYFAIGLALLFVLQTVVDLGISSPSVDAAFSLGTFIGGVGTAIATGLAILRYRLYDIDILIRRTLIYGTLTALLAAR